MSGSRRVSSEVKHQLEVVEKVTGNEVPSLDLGMAGGAHLAGGSGILEQVPQSAGELFLRSHGKSRSFTDKGRVRGL